MSEHARVEQRIGPYRILRPIGEGGMGVVHLAEDPEGRQVAIKVLRPHVAGDVTARRRLAREFETMRRVRSPYVAEVIDADVTGARPYVVTRYVPGRALDEVVDQEGRLVGARLTRLAEGLARALVAIHAAGVIHRDLKPANVMMLGDQPVVIDFGIAHAVDATRVTQTGMMIGTPGYLAPEIVRGAEPGPAADVHAWAATVAFAATGRPPFGSGAFDLIFFNIMQGEPDLRGVPAALQPVLRYAFAKEPERRPSPAWFADIVGRLDLTADPAVSMVSPPAAPWSAPTPSPPPPSPSVAPPTVLAPGVPPDPTRAYSSSGMPPEALAELLPPVRHATSGAGVVPAEGLGPPASPYDARPAPARPAAARPAVAGSGRHPLLLTLLGVFAVAVTVVLPVLGALAVLAVLVTLRAVDTAVERVSGRSPTRMRPTDAMWVIVGLPGALLRSVLVQALAAALAVVVAAASAAVLAIVLRYSSGLVVASLAAGVFSVVNCVGPGSRRPRRRLHRLFDAVTHTPQGALVTGVVCGALAFFALVAAMGQAPDWRPWQPPQFAYGSLADLTGRIAEVRAYGRGIIGRLWGWWFG